jgi:Leucine-rich repeat (LRR) protein
LCEAIVLILLSVLSSCFPQNLELADNKLEKVPESIVLLQNLTYLSIGNNKIGTLPCPEKLVTFSAPNNLLKEVPASLKDCKDLEVLDLSGNPLRPEFWSLVLQLKKLRQLSPQPPVRSTY